VYNELIFVEVVDGWSLFMLMLLKLEMGPQMENLVGIGRYLKVPEGSRVLIGSFMFENEAPKQGQIL